MAVVFIRILVNDPPAKDLLENQSIFLLTSILGILVHPTLNFFLVDSSFLASHFSCQGTTAKRKSKQIVMDGVRAARQKSIQGPI